uniref:SSD domain-containing protein n=1 Tax=Hydatigena taeniaeformis TaxID=6205 RepID=A0A0R3WN38_HYDTA
LTALLQISSDMRKELVLSIIVFTIGVTLGFGGTSSLFSSSYLTTAFLVFVVVLTGDAIFYNAGLYPLGDCERIVTLTECQRVQNNTIPVLSFRSLPAIFHAVEEFDIYLTLLLLDQSFWQGILSSEPETSGFNLIASGFFYLPVGAVFGTACGLGYFALNMSYGQVMLSDLMERLGKFNTSYTVFPEAVVRRKKGFPPAWMGAVRPITLGRCQHDSSKIETGARCHRILDSLVMVFSGWSTVCVPLEEHQTGKMSLERFSRHLNVDDIKTGLLESNSFLSLINVSLVTRSGLIGYSVLEFIFGRFGPVLFNTIIVCTVTSCTCSEVISISTIFVVDVYMTYIRPFKKTKEMNSCVLCGLRRARSGESKERCRCKSMAACVHCQRDDNQQNFSGGTISRLPHKKAI